MLAESFHQTFLAELYAGLISGAVTGLVVGLALLWFEKRSNRRLAYDAAMREIAVLKGKLKTSTSGRDVMDCSNAKSTTPHAAVLTLKLIEDLPIARWLDLVAGHEPVLAHLTSLQTNVAKYNANASDIDNRIQPVVAADSAMARYPELPSYIFQRFYAQSSGQTELFDRESNKNVVRFRTLAEEDVPSSFFANAFEGNLDLTAMIQGLYNERPRILEIIINIRHAIGVTKSLN
jgi:hypothetical protein